VESKTAEAATVEAGSGESKTAEAATTKTAATEAGTAEPRESFLREFGAGWGALTEKRGVFVLTVMGIAMTFCIGCIQSLYTPMLLGFVDSRTLGVMITVCASGMLLSSLILGSVPVKKGFARMMSVSLFLAGLCMAGFGSYESVIWICASGFLFFAMLPFVNTGIDYLIRTNIANELQGRVWGLIGIISQFGYIIAFSALGPLADYVFVPLLKEEGALAGSVGRIIGTGGGRGIGLMIVIAGVLLSVTAVILYRLKSIRELEKGDPICTVN
jgi:MFS family permease